MRKGFETYVFSIFSSTRASIQATRSSKTHACVAYSDAQASDNSKILDKDRGLEHLRTLVRGAWVIKGSKTRACSRKLETARVSHCVRAFEYPDVLFYIVVRFERFASNV